MTLSEQLADFIVATSYDTIPEDVVACAKRLLVDTLAVAWAGTTSDGVADVAAMVGEEGGRPEATLWGFGRSATAVQAAFVNGVASAALDYDSLHLAAMSHASIVTLPAAFALAERRPTSGRDFLAAFILGNEVHCRLGLATQAHSGWFYTSMHGVFGAAAAGAKVLQLDRTGVCNALGAALSHVGGTQQAIIERSLTKRMQSAFAARNGVFSALLAERGVKKTVKLAVSVPSHSALMQPAAEALRAKMQTLAWTLPDRPVIQNADACAHDAIAAIQDALVRQLYLPVRWTECVQALAARGITRIGECGPGKVLAGLCKRIDKGLDGRALATDLDAARNDWT